VNVATTEGEWTLDHLVSRLIEFQPAIVTAHADERGPGRHLADHVGTAAVNGMVDMIALAEEFTVARLAAIRSLTPQETRSWTSRQKVWKKKAQILLADFGDWNALMGFVEARNAAAHGLGRLTDMQLHRKPQVFADLDAAQLRRNGDRVLVSSTDTIRCGRVCLAFVGWLDVTAPRT
jgi:hypothetical protein